MDEIALVCDLFALSVTQRQRHAALVTQLAQVVEDVQELPNGYAFHYSSDTTVWSALTEWIDLERRCCPFLTFVVQLAPHAPLSLHLTGPDGVKTFLMEELPQFVR